MNNLNLKNASSNWQEDANAISEHVPVLRAEVPINRSIQLLPIMLEKVGPDEVEDDEDILQEDDPSEDGDDFDDTDEVEDD